MKKKSISYVFLVLLIIVGCGKKKSNTSTAEREIPVKVIQLSSVNSGLEKKYTGTVKEKNSTVLSFEVAGNVKSVLVEKGQQVKKGQLLATMDPANMQNIYNAASATANQAQDAYNRYKVLYDSNSIPKIKWIEVESKLKEAQSARNIAQKNLKATSLYAPNDGFIAERDIDPGMNVIPGGPAFKLVTIDKIDIRISVPESEITQIEQNQKAYIQVAAIGDTVFEGVVTEKGIVANPLSHTYDVLIELDNPEEKMLPGMICNVSLTASGVMSPYIVVPNNAVQINEKGESFVWTASNGRASRRVVKTGELTNSGVVVTEGLNNNDQVIVEGNHKVSEGMKITVQ